MNEALDSIRAQVARVLDWEEATWASTRPLAISPSSGVAPMPPVRPLAVAAPRAHATGAEGPAGFLPQCPLRALARVAG